MSAKPPTMRVGSAELPASDFIPIASQSANVSAVKVAFSTETAFKPHGQKEITVATLPWAPNVDVIWDPQGDTLASGGRMRLYAVDAGARVQIATAQIGDTSKPQIMTGGAGCDHYEVTYQLVGGTSETPESENRLYARGYSCRAPAAWAAAGAPVPPSPAPWAAFGESAPVSAASWAADGSPEPVSAAAWAAAGMPAPAPPVLRAIPALAGDSFIYWDMLTRPDNSLMNPGDVVTAGGGIKNQGTGGSGLNLTGGTSGGDGAALACAGPTGGGVDFGGTSGNNGGLVTTNINAPLANANMVLSVAFRLRAGIGNGSPILVTKAYPAAGSGWSSPYNAFGPSFSNALDGTWACSINIAGSDHPLVFGDRYKLPVNTDLWMDLVKRNDGTADVYLQGTKLAHSTPGVLVDWGLGEWMVGGNFHTATDTINGQIYFVELKVANLSDAQLRARARAWLGWQ